MKITSRAITILKNFAKINPGIVIQPGNWIRSSSNLKTSGAEAQVDDEFPMSFGIADIGDFLSVVSLFKDPEYTFNKDHILLKEGKFEQQYFYSAPERIVSKNGPFPNKEYFAEYKIDKSDLQSLISAAAAIKATHIVMTYEKGKGLVLKAAEYQKITGDAKAKSNSFTINVDEFESGQEFSYGIDKNLFTMIPGDYTISFFGEGNAKLVRFKSADESLSYYLSVESFSTLG